MPNADHPDAETPHRRAYEAAASHRDTRPVALVTGAARRIGQAIALELARAGFDIALHHRARDTAALDAVAAGAASLRDAGARVELFAADLADPAASAVLVPRVAQVFGRVDAVVNNASGFEYDSPATFDPALLEALIRSNTVAPIVLAQGLATQVARQAPLDDARGVTPCVVNLLDQKLSNPNPDYFSYTLTKAALQHASRLQAQALAPAVRVCAVSPGITLASGPMDEAEFAQARRLTALGHPSTPQDIARAVRFLLESPSITGVELAVDAGQHLCAQTRDVLFLARAQAPASPSPPGPTRAEPPRPFPERPPMHSLLHHPTLMDCRRLFLRNYEVRMNIGVHDFEKRGEQRVLINVELYVPLAISTPRADQLAEVLNYDFIRATIAQRLSRGHVHLQETLCDDVLALMLAHPNVRAARVSTEKPDVYPDCEAVGVEVFGLKA